MRVSEFKTSSGFETQEFVILKNPQALQNPSSKREEGLIHLSKNKSVERTLLEATGRSCR